MKSTKLKILFIHVPKTAGSSIYRSFKLNRITRHATINYLQIKKDIIIENYWIIGSVRNPWARIWSLYKYTTKTHKMEWEDWLYNPPEAFVHYKDVLNNNILQQKNYFLDKDSNIAVNEIIRLEHIREDIKKSEYLTGKFQTYLPAGRRDTGKGWKGMYDKESKQYVKDLCEWEIKEFGYTYED